MKKVLFELIMTNACNKRCPYCKLNFTQNALNQEDLDKFYGFLHTGIDDLTRIKVNFFGGEPLLNFENIQYFLEKTQNLKNIEYSIGTNGLLLSKKRLSLLAAYDCSIYLSIDTETGYLVLNKDFLLDTDIDIQINFIINPNTIEQSFDLFDAVMRAGFKKINIMPVFSTISWDKESFVVLKRFVHQKLGGLGDGYVINRFGYYNGFSADKQFILDTDLGFYQDLDSLLWIQKQNQNLVFDLRDKIHKLTHIGDVGNITMGQLLEQHSPDTILKLTHEIPKEQGYLVNYKLIDKILHG